MPECKILKSFHSETYGYLRAGSQAHLDTPYALDLRRNGLVEIQQAPERKQSFEAAPLGKAAAAAEPPVVNRDSVAPVDAGAARQSQSSRQVRASLQPTATTSKGNAKR